ncbi:MAG: DUF1850 domain-containing protein [Treponemataceae bacterium]|nr:DUF1850 domain-containing protein [Treponemataceae bacterium]
MFAVCLPTQKVLAITSTNESSQKIFSKSALNGFCILYTHSVNKGRVRDFFRVEDNRLKIFKTEFPSYGAGMPELQETLGATFKIADDAFSMEYERDVGKKIFLAVGILARHSIEIDGKEIFLEDFFAPQTRLEFQVKRISCAELLFAKIKKRIL